MAEAAFPDGRASTSVPPCDAACPVGVHAQGYIALARQGRYLEALELIRQDNILPGICGRICTHPCELECRRQEVDEPLAIRDIKRFVTDYELTAEHEETIPEIPARNGRIAVIGSGPAGLAAAADLARLGYAVTVFEREARIGGLLRYGIGPHRLPREILDRDIHYIERLGVQFKTSSSMPGCCPA
jgi:NADPH-dependent glutamate synthase beta subunit-like oxidoreductase